MTRPAGHPAAHWPPAKRWTAAVAVALVMRGRRVRLSEVPPVIASRLVDLGHAETWEPEGRPQDTRLSMTSAGVRAVAALPPDTATSLALDGHGLLQDHTEGWVEVEADGLGLRLLARRVGRRGGYSVTRRHWLHARSQAMATVDG